MKTKDTILYLARKFIKMIFTIWLVTTLIFFLIRLMPSNPVERYIENQMVQYGLTYEDAQARAAHLFSMDLDKPILEQYFDYITDVARLDFGDSMLTPGLSVMDIIRARLPWTLLTVGLGMVLSFLIGIAIGAVMAFKRDRWYEPIVSGFASVLSAVPDFLIAIFIILLLGVFKFNGQTLMKISFLRGNFSARMNPGWNMKFIIDVAKHAFAPVLTYMLSQLGVWILLMKGSATKCLNADYVTMAKIRGLSSMKVLTSYIGRNAMLPIVTEFAMRMGLIVSGSLIIEQLFVYQGIGLELVKATNGRDYPVMQGIFLIMSISMVVSNFIAELLYVVLDPRIKIDGGNRNG